MRCFAFRVPLRRMELSQEGPVCTALVATSLEDSLLGSPNLDVTRVSNVLKWLQVNRTHLEPRVAGSGSG